MVNTEKQNCEKKSSHHHQSISEQGGATFETEQQEVKRKVVDSESAYSEATQKIDADTLPFAIVEWWQHFKERAPVEFLDISATVRVEGKANTIRRLTLSWLRITE